MIFICAMLLTMTLFIINIPFGVELHVKVGENSECFLTVSLFFVKLFFKDFFVSKDTDDGNTNDGNTDERINGVMSGGFLQIIDLKKLSVHVKCGSRENLFILAMVIPLIDNLLRGVNLYVNCKKNTDCVKKVEFSTETDVFSMYIRSIIVVSLLDLAFCYINGLLRGES